MNYCPYLEKFAVGYVVKGIIITSNHLRDICLWPF